MLLKILTLSTELVWGSSKLKDTRIYLTRITVNTRWQITGFKSKRHITVLFWNNTAYLTELSQNFSKQQIFTLLAVYNSVVT